MSVAGSTRDVHRSVTIHCKGEVAIGFTSIHVGVGSRQDDPFGSGCLHHFPNSRGVAQVGVGRGRTSELLTIELTHQGLPQQSRGPEDSHAHASIVSWPILFITGSSQA